MRRKMLLFSFLLTTPSIPFTMMVWDQSNTSFAIEDPDLLTLAINNSKNLEFSFTEIFLSVFLFIVHQSFEPPGPPC